jgi:hypothetical protein
MTNEPMAHALETAQALLRLLTDLLDDDGCDDDVVVTPRLNRAHQHAQRVVNELMEIA